MASKSEPGTCVNTRNDSMGHCFFCMKLLKPNTQLLKNLVAEILKITSELMLNHLNFIVS